MFRIGRTMRSAKMNEMTPPKLMPPFQSTAASGTFPIEQTKDSIATMGPTRGPQNKAATGCRTRKKRCQNSVGTQRSEEHTSELQSPCNLVCRLLLEKKKKKQRDNTR